MNGYRYTFPVMVGGALAGAFSIWVLVMRLLQGTDPRPLPGGSIFVVVLAYFAAGIIGGVLVGLLRPLAHHMVGAAAVGALVGALIYAAFGLVAVTADRWSVVLPRGAGVGAIIGAFCGVMFKRAADRIGPL